MERGGRKRAHSEARVEEHSPTQAAPLGVRRVSAREFEEQSARETQRQLALLRAKLAARPDLRARVGQVHEMLGGDQLFEVAPGRTVRVAQRWDRSNDSTGHVLWAAGKALAHFLTDHLKDTVAPWAGAGACSGASVVELGAGVGCLPAIAATVGGCGRVVATDMEVVREAGARTLDHALGEEERGRAEMAPFCWGRGEEVNQVLARSGGMGFDLVLSADTVYDPRCHRALLWSAMKLLRPGGVCLVAYREREGAPRAFLRMARTCCRVWHVRCGALRAEHAAKEVRVAVLAHPGRVTRGAGHKAAALAVLLEEHSAEADTMGRRIA